jgi:hypothetical protein
MWIDMFPISSGLPPEAVDISPRKAKKYIILPKKNKNTIKKNLN